MNSYRCFIAIDLPKTVKKDLAGIQKRFSSWPTRVKWVEEQNFHLTLKFLGDVSELQIQVLEAGLEKVSSVHRKCQIKISGLGAFPGLKNPKVIWAGVEDLNRDLYLLWSGIEKELAGMGFAPEEKPFSPHLTLGRVKDPRPAPGFREIIQTLELKNYLIPVTEIRLMRSQLSRTGPVYSCFRSFPLQEHF